MGSTQGTHHFTRNEAIIGGILIITQDFFVICAVYNLRSPTEGISNEDYNIEIVVGEGRVLRGCIAL